MSDPPAPIGRVAGRTWSPSSTRGWATRPTWATSETAGRSSWTHRAICGPCARAAGRRPPAAGRVYGYTVRGLVDRLGAIPRPLAAFDEPAGSTELTGC